MRMLIREQGKGTWHAPGTTAYTDEAQLQALIAESPALLPGVAEGPCAVAREVALGEAGYVDVLLVEPDGEITLCECKLRANPEIRRQVVGQALAYAAALWRSAYEELDSAFQRQADAPLVAVFEGAVEGWEEEAFRRSVASNLKSGRFRLVIAVDEITEELKGIVTYLNSHTSSEIELLALELRRAADHNVEVLIPQAYGEESATEKGARRKRVWDEQSVMAGIREAQPPDLADRMIRLYEALRDAGARRSWGTGATPSVTVWLGEDEDEGRSNPVSVSLYTGGVAINFDFVDGKRSRDEMARLASLVREVPGVAGYLDGLEESGYRMHRGMAPEHVLASEEALDAFRRAIIEAGRITG